MKEIILNQELVERMVLIYEDIESAYNKVAEQIPFSCEGCPDNCCDSYFLHHTYAEWAYLWIGFRGLSEKKQQEKATAALTVCTTPYDDEKYKTDNNCKYRWYYVTVIDASHYLFLTTCAPFKKALDYMFRSVHMWGF